MKISYIVTINPIIPLAYLNVLINSLNLQTSKDFDVIFYNQTRNTESEIFLGIPTRCNFEYQFFSVEDRYFLGQYPIWDLYGFHQFLLDNNLVNDYFMSLHMEEFLDPSYTGNALEVLEESGLEIMLGNLHQTKYEYTEVKELGSTDNAESFSILLQEKGIHESTKWGRPTKPFFYTKSLSRVLGNLRRLNAIKWSKQLKVTDSGFVVLNDYVLEDIFMMSRKFADQYNWYNSKTALYFEDIHINYALGSVLKQITKFPAYFNKSKVYHLKHRKFYYQIEDEEFSTQMLVYDTDNPVLLALKEAINLYRNKAMSPQRALGVSRRNAQGRGTADRNYEFHLENIKEAQSGEKVSDFGSAI